MAWTDTKNWISEILSSADMNTYLSDNTAALKDPPSANAELNEASDYTTTSTTFVDVNATEGKFKHTITTNGGDVMVHMHGAFSTSISGGRAFLDVDVDGTRTAGEDGIVGQDGPSTQNTRPTYTLTFTRLITGLSAASHVFKLQWKCAGNAKMYVGASPALNGQVHPQFWVREVS